MATKQQPQPSAVAQPEMPVQQPVGYPAYPQQYVYADPNKGKAKLLTLEYALAMASTVVSAFLLINVITSVVGLGSNNGYGRNWNCRSVSVYGCLSCSILCPIFSRIKGGVGS